MDDFDFEIEEADGTDSNKELSEKSKKDNSVKNDKKDKNHNKDKNDNKDKKNKKNKKENKPKKVKKHKNDEEEKIEVKNHRKPQEDKEEVKKSNKPQDDVSEIKEVTSDVIDVQSQETKSSDKALKEKDLQEDIDFDFEEDEFEIIEEDKEYVRKKSNQRKQKMVRLVILAIIVLAVCSIGCFTFILKRAELDKFESILLDSQYDKAKDIYGNLMDSQRTQADTMIINKTTSIYEKYHKGAMESNKAIEELQKLDKVSVNDITEIDGMLSLFDKILTSEKLYEQAQDKYNEGNLISAIKLFRRVIKEDAHYNKAQAGIKKVGAEYRKSCVEEAEKFAEEENYDGAIKTMEKAMVILIEDEEASKQLQTYKSAKLSLEISDITDKVNVAVKNKKYVNAIKTVNDAIKLYGEDVRLTDMFASLQEEMYKEVNTYIDSKRYTVAISILKSYVRIVEDDKATELIKKYSSNVDNGKFIAGFKYSSEEGKSYNISDVADYKDAQGNRYESVIEVAGYKNLDKKGHIEFSNAKYKTLSGIIGYVSDTEVGYYKDGKGIVRIYGDGVEIFKSKTVSLESDNQEVAVNIAKYKTIKIAWEMVDTKKGAPYGIVLGDFKVN